MQREHKFKKEIGFIRSHSSKGLSKLRSYDPSDSQSFSSFECNNQKGNRRQDQEFSPYRQPQTQNSYKFKNVQHQNMHKTLEYQKMRYPPKSNIHKSDKKPQSNQQKNNNVYMQNKAKSVEKNKQHAYAQQFDRGNKSKKQCDVKPQITFSNQKLRMQYNAFNENSDKIENNQKILKQVNKICQRISQIKLDFQFNDSGNFIEKLESEQAHAKKNSFQIKQQLNGNQKLNKYEQFLLKNAQKQPTIYQNRQQEQFSLGGNSNRKNLKSSPQKQLQPYKMKLADLDRKLNSYQQRDVIYNNKGQILKGYHNAQHRLLIKHNRVSSLEDESSIQQCLQQDYKQQFTGNHNYNLNQPNRSQRNSNDFRNPGVIKTTSQYLRQDRVQYDDDDSLNNQGGLIQQYKTSQFKDRGIRRQIQLHPSKSKVHYSNSNSKNNLHQNDDTKKYVRTKKNYQTVDDKLQQQEGFFQSKGGICFGIDTRLFRENKNETEPHCPDGEYLRNRNKYSTTVNKKPKKVDLKQQLLKRRQMAKNYDQMARRMVFRN